MKQLGRRRRISRAAAPSTRRTEARGADYGLRSSLPGMSEAADRDTPPPLADAVGGALGIAESVLPSAAFVAYTATGQQTQPALIAAVARGAVFGIACVVRKQTPQFALAGVGGIAISAYVVSRTGRAEDSSCPAWSPTPATRSPTLPRSPCAGRCSACSSRSPRTAA